MSNEIYNARLADLGAAIDREHCQAQAHARTALEHARTAGKLLLEARSCCPRGLWMLWLENSFLFSKSTAYNYIKLAERWTELETNFQPLEIGVREALTYLKDVDERTKRTEAVEVAMHAPITPDLLPTPGTVKLSPPALLEASGRCGVVLYDPRSEGRYLCASHESAAKRPFSGRAVLIYVAHHGLPPLTEWGQFAVDKDGWEEVFNLFFGAALEEDRWHLCGLPVASSTTAPHERNRL